jgi:hypothetical protein
MSEMIARLILAGFMVTGLHACADRVSPGPADVLPLIDSVMSAQQKAWNSGNIPAFMEGYWHSDSLIFIGRGGVTRGWENTLNRYLAAYPDSAAMGNLNFTGLHAEVFSGECAFTAGKWELFRVSDTLSGHYSLIWRKVSDKWVIVADHSS